MFILCDYFPKGSPVSIYLFSVNSLEQGLCYWYVCHLCHVVESQSVTEVPESYHSTNNLFSQEKVINTVPCVK